MLEVNCKCGLKCKDHDVAQPIANLCKNSSTHLEILGKGDL